MSPNSGCLPRQTPGALIVTLLVTVQGTARALKHARAPSRQGEKRRGVGGIAGLATANAPVLSAFAAFFAPLLRRLCGAFAVPLVHLWRAKLTTTIW